MTHPLISPAASQPVCDSTFVYAVVESRACFKEKESAHYSTDSVCVCVLTNHCPSHLLSGTKLCCYNLV